METITDTNRIYRLLNTVKDVRALLTINLPDTTPPSDQSYTSAVLEVDSETGELLLDELLPNEESNADLTGKQLNIVANLYGVAIEFHTQVFRTGETDGISFYSAAIPNELSYAQQRSDYRVHISMLNRPSALLESPGLDAAQGQVLNISLGGACLLLDNSVVLEPGNQISNCRISLPGGALIECSADVCHVREESILHGRTVGKKQVGIAFNNISQAQRREQQAYIIKLQRAQVKTQPSNPV